MIEDPEVERLARELAAGSGGTPAEAVARLVREHAGHDDRPRPSAVFSEARRRLATIPDMDQRTADEIVGYDDRGLPV